MSQWYYNSSGQQEGPVSTEQIIEWGKAGQFPSGTMVWCEGMGDWKPAKKVPALAQAFARAAPTPAAYAPQPTAGYAPHAPEPAYAPEAAAQPAYVQQPAFAQQPAYASQPAYTPQPGYAAPGASLGYEGAIAHRETLFVSPQAIESLRATKPWVRFFSVLLFIGCAIIALYAVIMLIGTIGASSMSRRYGGGGAEFAAIGILGAVIVLAMGLLYFMPAVYLGRYASRINDLLVRRRQSDFEAALDAQKSYWKFIGIVTLIILCLYALMFVIGILMFGVAASRM